MHGKKMRTATLLLVALSVGLMAPAARSAEPDRSDDVKVAKAFTLYNEGRKLIDTGDYEAARRRFLEANHLVSRPAILYSLGYSETRTGHYAEGVNHLRQFLRGPHVDPKARSEATHYILPRAVPYVAQLQVETKTGASITIDGSAVGDAPLPDAIAVAPGKHHVTATLNGAASSLDVELAEGQTLTMSLPQTETPAAPTAAPAPAAPIAAPPATSTAAAASAPAPDHSTRPAPLRIWLTTGLGVAAVGALVGGVYFAGKSNDDANNAAAARSALGPSDCVVPTSSNCTSLADARNSQATDHAVSLVMYTGAGVLAAGAVVSWFFLPKTVAESSSSASALPLVGPGLLGIQWSKRF